VSRPKRPGAILWDLDGTIVDTGDLHFIAWQATLTAAGLVYGRTDFERDFGRSNPKYLPNSFLMPHEISTNAWPTTKKAPSALR
jgi:beta-phosphoglucomutase-like phosphatase (HAD superfamily)